MSGCTQKLLTNTFKGEINGAKISQILDPRRRGSSKDRKDMNEEERQKVELEKDGYCCACEEVPVETEVLRCSMCKKRFHGVCKAASGDEKWATKSAISNFNATSTKNNFMFFCNTCKTIMETNIADKDDYRVRRMERNMDFLMNEISEIKELLKSTAALPAYPIPASVLAPNPAVPIIEKVLSGSKNTQNQSNIWNDAEKLATIKAPVESVLIINKTSDDDTDRTNKEIVENVVIGSKIPVKKSFKSMNGNLVVVCDSVESRNELKEHVSAASGAIEMRSPNENKSTVSIVGLMKNYTKEEVIELLKQNYFLTQFSENNDIQEHIKVFAVKPLKGNNDVFQAFARVSKIVRQGFKTHNDKVTMGITTCKIYDQYQVKRCKNCQGFGHFYKSCPTAETSVCAKCGADHKTNDCTSTEIHCVNCAKTTDVDCKHRSDDPKCPSIAQQQEKMKANLNK